MQRTVEVIITVIIIMVSLQDDPGCDLLSNENSYFYYRVDLDAIILQSENTPDYHDFIYIKQVSYDFFSANQKHN